MIKVIEVKSTMFGSFPLVIEKALNENNITKENLIDIKFSHDGTSYALIIYEA
jgi:hypothetical protein